MSPKIGAVAALLGIIMILGQSPMPVKVQGQLSYQVGAWGDDASIGNLGAAVEIQTHAYDSYPGTFDYFWVGNNVADGSFIQFGYGIEPGSYCLKGSSVGGKFTCLSSIEQILVSDARWQWQYWPNREGHDFYYQIGATGSAGANGTWHEYGIMPGSDNSWSFELDGMTVGNLNFHAQESSDPAFLAAEKTLTSSSLLGNLGPVEFANLSYLAADGWRSANSLISFNSCDQTPTCPQELYGISSTSQNFTIAGSGVKGPASGSLLWTSGYSVLAIHGEQNARFQVSILSQQKTYQGNVLVLVPNGMYAYVTIPTPSVQTVGPLALIGGYDRFSGWTGDVHSDNLTIRVLMDANKQITSLWATQLQTPILVVVTLGGFSAVVLFARHRRKKLLHAQDAAMIF